MSDLCFLLFRQIVSPSSQLIRSRSENSLAQVESIVK